MTGGESSLADPRTCAMLVRWHGSCNFCQPFLSLGSRSGERPAVTQYRRLPEETS
jgi:hypothetical protein